MNPIVDLRRCGRMEYDDGLRAMRLHREVLKQGTDNDAILLLEHPPLFTLGRGATLQDVLCDENELERRGIEVHETDRGGEVTFHGPGQLVAYPIVNLAPDRKDVRKWVRTLENAMIRTCAAFGVEATRIDGLPGVWVRDGQGDRKIGAVGVHLSSWISTHGIALNVNTDLSYFDLIVPCGIRDKGVTTLQAEGVVTSVEAAGNVFAEMLSSELGVELRDVPPELPTVQVVVVRDDGRVLALRRTMDRGGFWQTVTGRIEKDETPVEAARRELFEETGATGVEVTPLHYVHDFPLDPGITRRRLVTVKWARETVFSARVPVTFDCIRAPDEHDGHEWLTPAEAEERLPYAGLRRAVRMAVARELGGARRAHLP